MQTLTALESTDPQAQPTSDPPVLEQAPVEQAPAKTVETVEQQAAVNEPDPPPPEDKPSRGRKPKIKAEMEIPARLLYVVGVGAKEDGKYAMCGVMIETNGDKSLVSATATDGRRLMVAECNRKLFDDAAEIYIPRMIARNAAKIAIARPQDDESGAVVTLRRHGNECHLTAYTVDGPVVFEWQTDPDLKFPPYREVIPDWSDSVGVARIGITPELVATTLHTLQKVVGKDPKVRVYLPPQSDRPIGLESQDGDSIKALAVVMPANIGDWLEKPQQVTGDGKPAPGAETAPLPFEDETWRSATLEEVGIKKKRTITALTEAGITTLGHLCDLQQKHATFWVEHVKGLGDVGREEIESAQASYWNAHPRTASPPAENTQEQKADGPGPLVWEVWENDGDGIPCEWKADNTAGVNLPNIETAAAYWVERYTVPDFGTVGTFGPATDVPELADDGPVPDELPTLEAAQQWCQQQNDAAWSRLKADSKTATTDSSADTSGASASSDPVSAASLGLTEDDIRKAYYPKLLKDASDGKEIVITEIYSDAAGNPCIFVPPQTGDSADYLLVPLLTDREKVLEQTAADRYAGILIKYLFKNHWLGSAAQSIRVSVKPAPVAESNHPELAVGSTQEAVAVVATAKRGRGRKATTAAV